MQKILRALLRAGVSLIPLKANSKAPIQDDWPTRPTYSTTEFFKHWHEFLNYGIRPGSPSHLKNDYYLISIDVDISDVDTEEEALAKLEELVPDHEKYIKIWSGSELGKSFHLVGVTDKPLTSSKIWRSEKKITLPDGRKKDAAQIEIFGSSKQHVGPGSIHPDGHEYEIEDEDYFFEVMQDIADGKRSAAYISSEVFEAAGTQKERKKRSKDDRLAGLEEAVDTAPVEMTDKEIYAVLDDLDSERYDDYLKWLDVAFALHIQFADDLEFGFKVFDWFSRKSDNYGATRAEEVWDSIKDDKGTNSITFRTLIREANNNRKEKAAREIEEDARDGEDDDDKPAKDRKWASRLDMTAEGKTKATAGNMALILQHHDHVKGLVALNDFNGKIVRKRLFKAITPSMVECKLIDDLNGDQWNDIHDANLRMFFEAPRTQGGYGMSAAYINLKDAIKIQGERNAFHPVKEWIEGVEWDGVERMESLWSEYLGCPDDEYHQETAQLFLTGAITRIYEPGMKFDFVPIMQGTQGKKKTTFVHALAGHPDWSGALDPNFKDAKKMVESMMGRWILEMPELAAFNRADVQSVKHFISSAKDTTRLSYDYRAQDFPRQCVFIGTTNDHKYLLDETGNRRYWPLETAIEGEIDIADLEKNVRQIWAEALLAYKALRAKHPTALILPLYLKSKAAQRMALKMQNNAMADSTADAWAEAIEEWLNKPINSEFDDLDNAHPENFHQVVSIRDIWEGALDKHISALNPLHKNLISAAMEKIPGWKHTTNPQVVLVGGKRTSKRGWLRVRT